MTSSIKQLLALGPIPADSEMSDELFEKYDKLLNFSQPLSYDDAAQLTGLFSPDCDGLNWAILKAIEEACDTSEELMSLADKCTSEEYAALLRSRRINNQIIKAGAAIFQHPGILILRRFSSIMILLLQRYAVSIWRKNNGIPYLR